MRKQIMISVKILLSLSLITGIIYPLLITGIADLLFKNKADGSIIKINDHPVGSKLIGQAFNSSAYFWPRPSMNGYNPLPSGGSNLSLTNKKLKDQVSVNEKYFIEANDLEQETRVPPEMLFNSGSGLDPHISPESAFLQVDRIVRARNFSANQRKELLALISKYTEEPQFNILGQERINVFVLNLELDKIK